MVFIIMFCGEYVFFSLRIVLREFLAIFYVVVLFEKLRERIDRVFYFYISVGNLFSV